MTSPLPLHTRTEASSQALQTQDGAPSQDFNVTPPLAHTRTEASSLETQDGAPTQDFNGRAMLSQEATQKLLGQAPLSMEQLTQGSNRLQACRCAPVKGWLAGSAWRARAWCPGARVPHCGSDQLAAGAVAYPHRPSGFDSCWRTRVALGSRPPPPPRPLIPPQVVFGAARAPEPRPTPAVPASAVPRHRHQCDAGGHRFDHAAADGGGGSGGGTHTDSTVTVDSHHLQV